MARRSTQRDWTLEDAAAAAARAEADKLRAEFEAKFRGAAAPGSQPAEDKPEAVPAEPAGGDDGLRRLRDTESDLDPDAAEEEEEGDEWDQLAKEDELPTFFEAIQPLMRRNQRGAGQSVGVDHLAKKWGLDEADIVGALKECGFVVPEDEDAPPVYLEYDGDLFWVNVNRRGELWVNTKEKPRPVFRTVPGTPVAPEAAEAPAKPAEESPAERQGAKEAGQERPEGRGGRQHGERSGRPEGESAAPAALPEGPALLERIRPMMRRNRGGQGGSGSTGFLSRALKCKEADLTAAFVALGLVAPEAHGQPPVRLEIGGRLWWLNRDQRGGLWINEGDVKKEERAAEAAVPAAAASAPVPDAAGIPAPAAPAEGAPAPSPATAPAEPLPLRPEPAPVLAAVRLLLKRTKTGSVAGPVEALASTLGKTPDDLLAALAAAGLKVPDKPREKPIFVEHAGEIFWLNKNAKDELWLNAKASKFAAKAEDGKGDAPKRERRVRSKNHPAPEAPAPETPPPSA